MAGDLIYNGVHLWLAENRPEGWLKNLAHIEKVGLITTVYAGHGGAGEASLIRRNHEYIQEFVEACRVEGKAQEAITRMKRLFPKEDLEVILELSVAARIK